MIGVNMGEDEAINGGMLDTRLFQRDQRRRAELNGKTEILDIDHETRIETSAGPEPNFFGRKKR